MTPTETVEARVRAVADDAAHDAAAREAARWCYGCGLRVDRPPMAGGCDCAHPADERGGCVCLPSWLAP